MLLEEVVIKEVEFPIMSDSVNYPPRAQVLKRNIGR